MRLDYLPANGETEAGAFGLAGKERLADFLQGFLIHTCARVRYLDLAYVVSALLKHRGDPQGTLAGHGINRICNKIHEYPHYFLGIDPDFTIFQFKIN